MTDTVLIQKNMVGEDIAWQIWRDTPKSQLTGSFTEELVNSMVEYSGSVNEGDVWNGSTFSAPS